MRSSRRFAARTGPRITGNKVDEGLPDSTGTVEIGHSILEEYQRQRQGLAPEAVAALIRWRLSHDSVCMIIAQTLSGLRSSIRVLEKFRFSYVGQGLEDGAIMYELRRDDLVCTE